MKVQRLSAKVQNSASRQEHAQKWAWGGTGPWIVPLMNKNIKLDLLESNYKFNLHQIKLKYFDIVLLSACTLLYTEQKYYTFSSTPFI